MPWPSLSEYNEAVQNPQHNFSDPELRGGTVRTNPMGLPIPISGGFATVYQVQNGARLWAVRCFQREIPDQQLRYAAISQHLAAAHLPYTVGFTFLSQGIRVRGQWFPVLKMEWVKGESLNTYIEKNLRNPAALLQLANQFLTMVAALQHANVAHGDLQHGNIIVAGGGLKLIDYDGMYVPGLAGFQSHETGHRNYQHPKRNAADFGLYLDNFSTWVIYLSLVGLSIDSSLWQQAGAGEENLLFRKVDFDDPHASTILALLASHADPRLQGLTNLFASTLYAEPSQVTTVQAARIETPQSASSGPPPAAEWLKDHLQPGSSSSAAAAKHPAPPPADNIDWVLDFVSPPQASKHFIGPWVFPRLSLSALLFAVVAVFALHIPMAFGGSLIGAVAAAVAVTLFLCYRSDPAVAEKQPLFLELQQRSTALAELQRSLAVVDKRIAALHAEHNKTRQTLDEERSILQRHEQQELGQVQARLNKTLLNTDAQLQDLDRPIQRIRADLSAQTGRLQQQVIQLTQTEAIETSNALRLVQQQFVNDSLCRHRIAGAGIHGIGPQMAANLAAAGFVTASDITWAVTIVRGIGDAKASSLMSWRQHLEQRATATMPQSLTQAQMSSIQTKRHGQRVQLQQQIASITQAAQQQEQAVRAQNAFRLQQLQEGRASAQTLAQQQSQLIASRFQQECAALSSKEAQASDHLASELKKSEAGAEKARKETFEVNWQIAKTRRSLESYRQINLFGYVQQSIGMRRPPS